jgi:hypothetical protein
MDRADGMVVALQGKDYLAFDPMAGGGVTPDTCLALGRRCWSLDMADRPDTRPEIEPCFWDFKK